MKRNFNREFCDAFGKAVISEKTGKGTNIADSLCVVLFNLNNVGGQPLTADKKYSLHSICKKIAANPDEVEITTEECTLLKEVAAEAYACGAYGQIVDIIEGNV